MKCIKERLARRANRADGCTGHFWEGRFRSVPLLDQAAVLACMAYVDLNPIRAAIADWPETSAYTSVQDHIRTRQTARRQARRTAQAAAKSPARPGSLAVLDVDEYLTLVDETGRIVRAGKRGAIPTQLAPILDRLELELDLDAWLGLMQLGGSIRGGAFGRLAARAAEALRRGTRWVDDIACGLYRDEQALANA